MTTMPSIAAQILAYWGATVEPIPTSAKEESDLLATLGGCRLLIEEKAKFDDPNHLVERQRVLDSGEVHMSTTSVTPSNRLAGIVKKAAGQLASSAEQVPHDLRLIWFTSVGVDATAKYHQFMATLYGSTKIFVKDDPTGLRTCYFFRNSEFFRHAFVLDGAIAAMRSSDGFTVMLCLNPLSHKYAALRSSPLSVCFTNGIIDPQVEEAEGIAYIADTDVDRNDASAVLAYIQQKYATGLIMNMDMGVTTATISVPANAP